MRGEEDREGRQGEAEKRRLREREEGGDRVVGGGTWKEEQGEMGHTGTGEDGDGEEDKGGKEEGRCCNPGHSTEAGRRSLPAGAWTASRGRARPGGLAAR